MRAMRLAVQGPLRPDSLESVSLPDPEPGPGEAVVRVEACGVCRTDLHLVEGDLAAAGLPRVPGHQIVGRVESLGPGTTRLRHGDRVGVPWLAATCGACAYCATGRENLCVRARCTGLHFDGGYAARCRVPEEACHPLPPGPPAERLAPLLCAGVIGWRALKLADVAAGQTLGLVGFGASAHLTIQSARARGVDVVVFTRSERHRRLAKSLGASWAGGLEHAPPAPLDGAIVFAPAGETVPAVLAHTAPAACVALAGVTMSDIPGFPHRLLSAERRLRSVTNATWSDVRDSLDLALREDFRVVVETFPLAKANEALAAVRDSRVDGSAVLRVL